MFASNARTEYSPQKLTLNVRLKCSLRIFASSALFECSPQVFVSNAPLICSHQMLASNVRLKCSLRTFALNAPFPSPMIIFKISIRKCYLKIQNFGLPSRPLSSCRPSISVTAPFPSLLECSLQMLASNVRLICSFGMFASNARLLCSLAMLAFNYSNYYLLWASTSQQRCYVPTDQIKRHTNLVFILFLYIYCVICNVGYFLVALFYCM